MLREVALWVRHWWWIYRSVRRNSSISNCDVHQLLQPVLSVHLWFHLGVRLSLRVFLWRGLLDIHFILESLSHSRPSPPPRCLQPRKCHPWRSPTFSPRHPLLGRAPFAPHCPHPPWPIESSPSLLALSPLTVSHTNRHPFPTPAPLSLPTPPSPRPFQAIYSLSPLPGRRSDSENSPGVQVTDRPKSRIVITFLWRGENAC